MSTSINEMLNDFIKNIDVISETKKVIGEPMVMDDGTIIVPVSKVSMGFGGGGSDFGTKPNIGAGVGGGVKVTPEAFLVVSGGNVRLIPVGGGSTPLDKAIDLLPGLIDKVNGIFSKNTTPSEGDNE